MIKAKKPTAKKATAAAPKKTEKKAAEPKGKGRGKKSNK